MATYKREDILEQFDEIAATEVRNAPTLLSDVTRVIAGGNPIVDSVQQSIRSRASLAPQTNSVFNYPYQVNLVKQSASIESFGSSLYVFIEGNRRKTKGRQYFQFNGYVTFDRDNHAGVGQSRSVVIPMDHLVKYLKTAGRQDYTKLALFVLLSILSNHDLTSKVDEDNYEISLDDSTYTNSTIRDISGFYV